MRLSPFETDRLLVFLAAELARRNREAGLALNHPEAVALVADAMLMAARRGAGYEEIEAAGRAAVHPGEVMPGVASMVDEVRVEVLTGDGTRLVVLDHPIGGPAPGPEEPGAIITDREPVDPLAGREHATLTVRNESTRAVQVSSHVPFHEVNERLVFERAATRGFRLDLPSGGTERWEPGETRTVTLVRYAGRIGALAGQPGGADGGTPS
jgi:urease subunit gamma/beta